MNDFEEKSASFSVEEEKQRSAIQSMEKYLNSVKSETESLEQSIVSMHKEKTQVICDVAEKTMKIASLEAESTTLSQVLLSPIPSFVKKTKELRGHATQCQDRSTGDVVVRIRTQEGRDDRFYSQSHILKKCKYFADRLSEEWPTCQILDSRNCVELYCEEPDFNHHLNVLRLLCLQDHSLPDNHFGVRNALGILRVSIHLGCPHIIQACVNYLEAVPWEETEEEEVLRVVPSLGSVAERILARLYPVDSVAIVRIFIAALHLATSSSPSAVKELKSSAQEQLEYILTEDDDAPLLTIDDGIRSEVIACVMPVLTRFYDNLQCLLDSSLEVCHSKEQEMVHALLSDLSWSCQILLKLEMMKEFVHSWVDSSETIVTGIECLNASGDDMLEVKLKVIEVSAKVLEAVGYGNVILPTERRLHLAKVWLQFIRKTKPLFDAVSPENDDWISTKMDGELWQIMESALVSIVLALPSADQAEILTEWLSCDHIRYPDLTEAFEMWCYRSKVARRRMAVLGGGKVG